MVWGRLVSELGSVATRRRYKLWEVFHEGTAARAAGRHCQWCCCQSRTQRCYERTALPDNEVGEPVTVTLGSGLASGANQTVRHWVKHMDLYREQRAVTVNR